MHLGSASCRSLSFFIKFASFYRSLVSLVLRSVHSLFAYSACILASLGYLSFGSLLLFVARDFPFPTCLLRGAFGRLFSGMACFVCCLQFVTAMYLWEFAAIIFSAFFTFFCLRLLTFIVILFPFGFCMFLALYLNLNFNVVCEFVLSFEGEWSELNGRDRMNCIY